MRKILIAWFCFFCLPSLVWAEDYRFRHISMEQGLPQMSVTDIFQDAEGYMWIATRQGAARYDGRDMQIFNPSGKGDGNLLSPVVEQIVGDTLLNVYIRTTGINRYNLREGKMSVVYPTTVDEITALDNGVCFVAEGKLFRYDAKNDSVCEVCALPKTMAKVSALQYLHGILYIATIEGQLYSLHSNRLNLLYELGSQIACLYETQSHTIAIGTWYHGMYLMDRSGLKRMTMQDGLVSNFVRAIYEDDRKQLWIGTDVGLQRLSDKRIFLKGQSVWHLASDDGGNLWVGTYFDGLFFFNPKVDFYTDISLPFEKFPVISHILPLQNRLMVLCTEGDGLYVVTEQGKVLSHLVLPNIKSVYYDEKSEVLYIGSHLYGLYALPLAAVNRWDGKALLTLHPEQYMFPFEHRNGCQIVRAIVPKGDDLLVGTHNGVYVFSPQRKRFSLLSDSLDRAMPQVVSMVLSSDGKTLYLGGEKLLQFDLQSGDILSKQMPFTIETMLLDQNGRMWVGTDGNGVWQCNLRADKAMEDWISYSTYSNGLQNDYVRNLLLTPMGHVLVVTTKGFSIIQSNPVISSVPFSVSDYSPGTYLPLSSLYNGGVALAPNGDILLAGMDGLVKFREEHLFHLSVVPSITFEHRYQYVDKVRLPRSLRHLNIHYAIQTNNLSPENLSLRYCLSSRGSRMEQTLDDWIGDIRLMNLPYGMNYLDVQVVDNHTDSILTTRQLAIRVRPPVYISWPAIVCYVLLIITALAMGVYYLRRRFLEELRKQDWNRYEHVRKEIDEYIEAHLCDSELDVSQLCKQLGIGRTRLFQVFREVYDTTPQQLIAERRLQRAADWLENKLECNISEIAYDLGYQSPKYFSYCFKERFGMTPSAYRKSKKA